MDRKGRFLFTACLVALFFISLWFGIRSAAVFDHRGWDGANHDTASNAWNGSQSDGALAKKVKSMTIDEKLGQMVIAGVDGYTLNQKAVTLIEQYDVGAVIIMGANVRDANQLLSLVRALKETNKSHSDIPLFLAVDQEGGRVDRMPAGFVRFPSSAAIGKVADGHFAFLVGQALAKEIKAFGFNMELAPVLDVNSNQKNPVIGDRSLGSDPELVSILGLQVMKGIQSEGVISVVKHFPGHGDTSTDSHLELPVVNKSFAQLKSLELVPFAVAFRYRADAVMVAHILLPHIDADKPASLSHAVIDQLLRKELNFDGLAMTDDLTMGAITDNYGLGEAAVMSVKGGADMVMVAHGFENVVSVLGALKKAVLDGTISEQRVNESTYRILSLKEKYAVSDEAPTWVDVNSISNMIRAVLSTKGM